MKTIIATFDSELTIGQICELCQKASIEHPGCEISVDGDMKCIYAEDKVIA